MDRGAWGCKESDSTQQLTAHTHTHTHTHDYLSCLTFSLVLHFLTSLIKYILWDLREA